MFISYKTQYLPGAATRLVCPCPRRMIGIRATPLPIGAKQVSDVDAPASAPSHAHALDYHHGT